MAELLDYLRKHEAWHRAYATKKENEPYPDLVAGSVKEAEKWGRWADSVQHAIDNNL